MAHPGATHQIPCQDIDCVFPSCVNSKLDRMMRRGDCGTEHAQSMLLSHGTIMNTSTWPGMFDTEEWWKDLHGIIQLSPPYTRTTFCKELERGVGILDSQLRLDLRQIPQTDQTVSVKNQAAHRETYIVTNDRSNECHENRGKPPPYCNSFPQNLYSATGQATPLRPLDRSPNIAADNQFIPNAKAGRVQGGVNGKPQSGAVKPSNNNIYGILSLLFQTIGSRPVTAELEQCYVRVLENAYTEINLLQATSALEQIEQTMRICAVVTEGR